MTEHSGFFKSRQMAVIGWLERVTTFKRSVYFMLLLLLLASGLSFDAFNRQNFFGEYFSANRLLWLILLLFMLLGLKIEKIKWSLIFFLFSSWTAINVINLFLLDGYVRLIIVRCFQAAFIMATILSVHQGKLKLDEFLKILTPIWVFCFTIGFVFLFLMPLMSVELFLWLKDSIFGLASNFSIFCSQFIAILLFQNLIAEDQISAKSKKGLIALALSVCSILLWQVSSDGRTGLLLSVFTITFFCGVRFGILAGLIGLIGSLCAVICIESALTLYVESIVLPVIGEGFSDKTITNSQGGLFRQQFRLWGETSFLGLLEAINLISSNRLYGFLETVNRFSFASFMFGHGVGNFKILNDVHYPHIELLRHLMELGLTGLIISATIYILPFISHPKDELDYFSLLYLGSFLFTTLLQPSGPLIHLNSGFLFWLVYAHVIKKEEWNQKRQGKRLE